MGVCKDDIWQRMMVIFSFHSGGNPIRAIPTELVNGFADLVNFSCMRCSLGPTIHSGTLNFNSNALEQVELGYNEISIMEPEAITGTLKILRVKLFTKN